MANLRIAWIPAAGHTCRYLAYAETSAIGRAVQHLLERPPHHVHLEKIFVSRLAAVLKSMVLDGKGLAWLPESHVAQELASGQLVRAGSVAWDLEVEITIFRPARPFVRGSRVVLDTPQTPRLQRWRLAGTQAREEHDRVMSPG